MMTILNDNTATADTTIRCSACGEIVTYHTTDANGAPVGISPLDMAARRALLADAISRHDCRMMRTIQIQM